MNHRIVLLYLSTWEISFGSEVVFDWLEVGIVDVLVNFSDSLFLLLESEEARTMCVGWF